MKKTFTTLLASALAFLSPGIGCYEALAQSFHRAASGRMVSSPSAVPGTLRVAPGALTLSASVSPALPGTLPSLRSPQGALLPEALPVSAPSGRGERLSFGDGGSLTAAPSAVAPRLSPAMGVAAARSAPLSATPAAVSDAASPERAIVAPSGKGVRLPAGDGGPLAFAPSGKGVRLPAGDGGPLAAAAAKSFSPSVRGLLSDPRSVALPVQEVSAMSAAQVKDAGASSMDRILGQRVAAVEAPVAASIPSAQPPAAGLARSAPSVEKAPASVGAYVRVEVPKAVPTKSERLLGVAKALARVGAGAVAVYGVHSLAVALLPAVFGLAPVAAVWAIGSGVLLLPPALYARHRLSLRDSPRLAGVKTALDLFLGAYLGAVAVTLPALYSGAVVSGLALMGPAGLAAVSAGTSAAMKDAEGTGGLLDTILSWVALTILPPFIGVAAAGPLSLASLIGLAALPAMTTVAFFLGRIIFSAESGRPFAIPGSTQPIRFPAYTWVMTGVVFALLTGYAPVWTNAVFAVWMLAGNTRFFDLLWAGAAAWAAATGFAAPITFLVLAFAPERAAVWTERLLGRLLKPGEAAPSTQRPSVGLDSSKPARWPAFHFVLKTGLLLGTLAGLGAVMSATVFGVGAYLTNLGIAAGMALLPFLFSRYLIKAVMKATPMEESLNPEIYGMVRELRERINADRTARGQTPIPMPEMVDVPMGVPNAFATGPHPMKAMVGVTAEMKWMTLEPEGLREGLLRLFQSADPSRKSFAVFRRAVRGSVSGVSQDADRREIMAALRTADEDQLKALGVRVLRGVMAHELSHVMNRDMLIGAIAGAMSSAIAYASYGVLWAVGHAQNILEIILGKARGPFPWSVRAVKEDRGSAGFTARKAGPEMVEPMSAGTAVTSALGILRIFAALWGPVLATILQMASSRTREGAADESGALLSQDPEALALGLGLLTSWRPAPGFTIDKKDIPAAVSQAHLMTVSPVGQLRAAGLLPKPDRLTRWAMGVGKEDDFFLNLFITHPDTGMRIERLHDMAEALAPAR